MMNILFDFPNCHICRKALMPKRHRSLILNGFRDADTGQSAHFTCRRRHYLLKAIRGLQGLYSETPLMMRL